jgi:hypothetical protein
MRKIGFLLFSPILLHKKSIPQDAFQAIFDFFYSFIILITHSVLLEVTAKK